MLHDMRRPLRVHIDSDFAQTVLLFPRTALLRRLGEAEPYIGTRVNGAVGVAGMLSSSLRELPSHLDRIPDAARQRVADNVLDLIATALISTDERPLLSAAMTWVRVKLRIETHLGEELFCRAHRNAMPDFEPDLNRLFAREGTSLMHYAWERRHCLCSVDQGRRIGKLLSLCLAGS